MEHETRMGENTNAQWYLEENPEHLVDIGVDGKMIRKLISQKCTSIVELNISGYGQEYWRAVV